MPVLSPVLYSCNASIQDGLKINKLKFVTYHSFLDKISENLINNQFLLLLTRRCKWTVISHNLLLINRQWVIVRDDET